MKNDNKPKHNMPIIISVCVICFLMIALIMGIRNTPTLSLPNRAEMAIETSTDLVGDTNETRDDITAIHNPPTYTKKNVDGFVYKSDKRSFDQRPADITAKQMGWTEKNDMMVLIKPKSSNMPPFHIDAFEAFISNYRAWSVPDVHPTDKIKYGNAAIACKSAGKRLCTVQEWRTACRGGHTKPIAFKNTRALAKHCYFATSKGYDRTDYVEKTDSHIACTPSGQPLYHMIGNVAEFVTAPNNQIMVVGLAYYDGGMNAQQRDIALGQACERIVANPGQYPAHRYNKGTGFRCCRDAK